MSADQKQTTGPCGCLGWPIDIVWKDRGRDIPAGFQCSRCGAKWDGAETASPPIASLSARRRVSNAA